MNKPQTYDEALKWAFSYIKGRDVTSEDVEFVIRQSHGWSAAHLLSSKRESIGQDAWNTFQKQVELLSYGVPAQYVVRKAPFYGRVFKVDERVLIPEYETEELVDQVLQRFPQNRPKTVLDIGTGSGVIGITLKLERPTWQVTATDISAIALRVAKGNAVALGAQINLIMGDLFAPVVGQRFDLIVANPPYVGHTELEEMDRKVIDHVPHQALFASHNGYAIYERIAEQLQHFLTPQGELFAEIGYQQGPTVRMIFAQLKEFKVEIIRDINGKDRIVHVWPGGSV